MTDMTIIADARCLQDEEYATKGIGQHASFALTLLRQRLSARLVGWLDPLLPPVRQESRLLFDELVTDVRGVQAGFYFNPSPLTHDTAFALACRRRGMRLGAIVHDFIPLHDADFAADGVASAHYRYLVQTLRRYDFLAANSDWTLDELRRYLPDYAGEAFTLHCKSRFDPSQSIETGTRPKRRLLDDLGPQAKFVFLAAADDPRKNTAVAIKAARDLLSVGARLVIGGGLSETTKREFSAKFPDQMHLGRPIFLPRLTDEELRYVYTHAVCVLVTSFDEGFSLPVSEAIALGKAVVASDIAAHREQVCDARLLFNPHDVSGLVAAVRHALSLVPVGDNGRGVYRHVDYETEATILATAASRPPQAAPNKPTRKRIIVGPEFDKATGIAVYNKLLMDECTRQRRSCDYVDVDAMPRPAFYDWLSRNQDNDIIYVMGNNNIYHSHCYEAILNLPGQCIMHDSRLFEFLLNRDGPYKIVTLANKRNKTRPIDIPTVQSWQSERRHLPHSFLEPLTARCTQIFVHSKISEQHIRSVYEYDNVRTLPFATQMTKPEKTYVADRRKTLVRASGGVVKVAMLGETEPTKGCSELIFAIKFLKLMGVEAELYFVGKSDEPYHSELLGNIRAMALEGSIHFLHYVSRQTYLEYLGGADVVVQLRYALFGQVSGPLGDALACGVPVVTTQDLAYGADVHDGCEIIPNAFSPLHIAMGIRKLMQQKDQPRRGRTANVMRGYVQDLFREAG